MASRIQVMQNPVLGGMAQGLKGLGGLAGNIVGGVMQKRANDRDLETLKADSGALLKELENNQGLREQWDQSGYGVGYEDFLKRLKRPDKMRNASQVRNYLGRQFDIAEKVLGDKLSTNWLAQASETFGVGDFGQRIKDRKEQDAYSKLNELMGGVGRGDFSASSAISRANQMEIPSKLSSQALGRMYTLENQARDRSRDWAGRKYGEEILSNAGSMGDVYTMARDKGMSEAESNRLANLWGSQQRLNSDLANASSGGYTTADDRAKQLAENNETKQGYVEDMLTDIKALDAKIQEFAKKPSKGKSQKELNPVMYNALLKQRKEYEKLAKMDDPLLYQLFPGEDETTMSNAAREYARKKAFYEVVKDSWGRTDSRWFPGKSFGPTTDITPFGWQWDEKKKVFTSPEGKELTYDQLEGYGKRFEPGAMTGNRADEAERKAESK